MMFPTMSRRQQYWPMSAVDQELDPGAALEAMKTQSPQGGPVDGPRRGMGGIFGGVARWLTPERMQAIGATMQQMSGDNPNALAQFGEQRRVAGLDALGARERAARQSREEQSLALESQEQAISAQERAQLEEMIASLPPDQQMLARLNPQAFVSGIMRHRYPAPQRWMDEDQPSGDDDGWTYED